MRACALSFELPYQLAIVGATGCISEGPAGESKMLEIHKNSAQGRGEGGGIDEDTHPASQ